MDEYTERNRLVINQIYKEAASGLYFWTPNGEGVFWYDTFEDAVSDMGWDTDNYPNGLEFINELED